MIKFKVTSERAQECLSILDYLAISGGNKDAAIRVSPRFVIDKDGEYIVKVKLDEDGDIESLDGLQDAFMRLASVTPKRLERLSEQLTEAVKAIVDPQKGGGLTKPSTTEPEQPPPG